MWADYASGGGTAVLSFAYEVVSTDSSTDGVAVVADSLESNGGSVASAASGTAAELSHPGLAHDAGHLVDGSQQTGTPVAPPDGGDENEQGGDSGDSGDGGDAGDAECPEAPAENGGAVGTGDGQDGQDDGGDADCPEVQDEGEQAEDPAAPSVSGVAIASDPGADGTYGPGDQITVELSFSEAVSVDTAAGTPRLSIDLSAGAGGEVWADYASGGGTAVLSFAYAVVSTDSSTDGVAVVADSLESNGGSVASAASGTAAELSHPGLAHDAGHLVDGSQQTGTPVTPPGEPEEQDDNDQARAECPEQQAGDGQDGEQAECPEEPDEAGAECPEAPAGNGGAVGTGDGQDGGDAECPAPPEQQDEQGGDDPADAECPEAPAENGGAVGTGDGQDGNDDAEAGCPPVEDEAAEDPAAPSVMGLAITSQPGADGSYGLGEQIDVQVLFSEAVAVDTSGGSPRLKIDFSAGAGGEVWAAYTSGGGTSVLTFSHEVAAPDLSTDGVAVVADSLELNGGSVASTASGAAVALSHRGLAHNPSHPVDGSQPADGPGGPTAQQSSDPMRPAGCPQGNVDMGRITAVTSNGTTITVTFGTLNSGANGYALAVELCKPGTGNTYEFETVKTYTTTETPSSGDTFAITGLTSETDYWVRVHSGSEVSAWFYIRTKAAGTVPAACGVDGTVTTLITSLTSTITTVTLTFGSHDTSYGYEVYICRPKADNTYEAVNLLGAPYLPAAGEMHTATGLMPGTDYWFRVQYPNTGDGVWHHIRTKVATPPSTPAIPSIGATSSIGIEVIWSAPSDPGSATEVLDYELRYYAGSSDPTDEEDWITEGETNAPPDPGANTSARILGLTAGTTYRMQVRALGDVWSPWSASVAATTSAALSREVLISNTEQTRVGSWALSDHDVAIGFTTGANSGGYLLTGVDVDIGAFGQTGHQMSVKIATGLPSATTVVATLFNPVTLSAGTKTFAAPGAGVALNANTTYWVVLESDVRTVGSGILRLNNTGNDDSGGSAGWSIADRRHQRDHASDGVWTEVSATHPLRIRVRGLETDATPPTVDSAEVVGDELQITWDEDLDTGSLPPPGAFTVMAGSQSISVHTVAPSATDASVTILTLASPVRAGQTVTLGYTKPSTNPLKDPFGNEVATFSGTSVTNSTELTVIGVEISSIPCTDSTYGIGDVIRVKLTFSEPANVTGTPRRAARPQPAPRRAWACSDADYESGTGTTGADFRLHGGGGQHDGRRRGGGGQDTLQLNGGTIKSPHNADATLDHAGLGHNPFHQVDGSKATAGTRCEQLLAYSAAGLRRHPTGEVEATEAYVSAAGFTTGAASAGYTVSRVRVDLGTHFKPHRYGGEAGERDCPGMCPTWGTPSRIRPQ